MPTEKTDQIHLVVTPDRKESWEDSAKDHPNCNGSLSQLIRLAVEKELAQEPNSGGSPGEEVGERLSEVLESNRQLDNRLQGLEARLRSIEQAVQEDPEISELSNEVFRVLPTRAEVRRFEDPEGEVLPPWLPEEQGGPNAYSGEVDAISKLVDAQEAHVRKALEKLQSETSRVLTTDSGRFYKEE